MREGWTFPLLKEITEECRGSAALRDAQNYELWSVPSFSVGHPEIVKGSSILSAKRPVKAGDVLLCKINPRINRVWVVGDNEALPKVASTEWIVLRAKSRNSVSPRWLQLYLSSSAFRSWIVGEISGATGSHTRAKPREVMCQRIPIPPLSEQKRIVDILDEAFAGLATAVANTEKNLANARELFESYLNSVFSQRGAGWQERKLSDVCINLDSKRVPITKSKRQPGEIPYYGASGVVDHVADHIFDEDLLLVSEDGANLLARTYPIAFSISGKSWVNNHAHVLRFDAIESQRFIEYYLNSISLEPHVSGMAQPKLNQKALNSIKVPFPRLDQQKVVVDKLDEIAGGKKQLSDLYRQKLGALLELKQSLMQKAFSGELTAVPQDEIETALA